MSVQFFYGVSSNGKIHKTLGPSATLCSSSNRGLRTTQIDKVLLGQYHFSRFCNKCFSRSEARGFWGAK